MASRHLVDAKAMHQAGGGGVCCTGRCGRGDPKQWIFDTGASNHMTSVKEVFTDLDTSVISTVCFGDGSVVQIKGCDTILFTCKNGEHQTFANTYYIP
jgi:hypothetical protein